MALGEFDLNDMLEGKLNDIYDETTLYMIMLMVTFLAILGRWVSPIEILGMLAWYKPYFIDIRMLNII